MSEAGNAFGTLYLVATPIGNLSDITQRAASTLSEVDIIAAEDTRHTLKLLNHLGIKKPLVSYHEHNRFEKGEVLIRQLQSGKNIALVTDAGSPGISDPGEDMVKLAVSNAIPVTMIPGAAALILGLVLSGLPAGRFVFEGFLPANRKERLLQLKSLSEETRTIVFYEAPHKLKSTLNDLREIFGDRQIALARELTKKFEEVVRCTIGEAIEKYSREAPKGEFVLVLAGCDRQGILDEKINNWKEVDIEAHLEIYIKKGLDKKDAMKRVAEDKGITKREVYAMLLKKKDN